ncbi:hypothetical protein PSEHALCIP103_00948 [Pseudoalteromonas haloplanktis]|uniref:MAE-28990/MAE-18760-like HEPN domain-containing protein n=1 Tax=Pseudoalteromonas haloplanktis TaxID=228 RepID=A0A9W4QUN2_PSEHA|nr:MAE_28990/MAE_18760 family HEPN-like nuclease [Pseudoalteromonas haloplanktis]PHQ93994.1 MAG: hypothetical protein COB48_06525 [Pseudoalteromonas sp.]CAH9054041.1 hypothetical protein PSEHALCIP103_00948 [Pseudoalteromonas haloplanktis]
MEYVKAIFYERINDIESYFELVDQIEKAVGSGGASLNVDGSKYNIKPNQQKIMYSGIYLHLYNLIEATISLLIEAIETHASEEVGNNVSLLTDNMRALYIKSVTTAKGNLSDEKRLEKAIDLFEQVLNIKPVEIKLPLSGGGNWGFTEIKAFSKQIGVIFNFDQELKAKINKKFRDDKKPIRLIKEIRNKLAHGSLSFTECGQDHVASEFRELINIVKEFLEAVIEHYDAFINNKGYRIVDEPA